MARPLVIAYHLCWTAYGHWLPNDPRGSGSTDVNSPELAALRETHLGRKKVQPSRNDLRTFLGEAAEVLRYPVMRFGPEEIATIAAAFADARVLAATAIRFGRAKDGPGFSIIPMIFAGRFAISKETRRKMVYRTSAGRS